ncbi:MAG: transposase [Gemmatimonadota bacterium]|nr:transposase [Gemmatimonadota bacterium]
MTFKVPGKAGIAQKLERFFLLPLKSNRNVALSTQEKELGQYQAVSSLALEQGRTYQVWVEQCSFPLLLTKLVFTNEDGTTGTLYLVSNDLTLDAERMNTLYQRRWSVEEYHASLKGNTALAAAPTKTKRTQLNHVFASIYAFVKLEVMRVEVKLNHFALRSKLYFKALQASFDELKRLKAIAGLA